MGAPRAWAEPSPRAARPPRCLVSPRPHLSTTSRRSCAHTGAGALGWMNMWEGSQVWVSPFDRPGLPTQEAGGVTLTIADLACEEGRPPRQSLSFFLRRHRGPHRRSIPVHERTWPTPAPDERLDDHAGRPKSRSSTCLTWHSRAKHQDVRTAVNHATREGVGGTLDHLGRMPPGMEDQITVISQAWSSAGTTRNGLHAPVPRTRDPWAHPRCHRCPFHDPPSLVAARFAAAGSSA